jgi:hypothetical protein
MINFDSPTRETCTVRETRTNTPLQALTLMNDVTYVEASRKLAELMLRDGGATPESRINYAYLRALARPARPGEVKTLENMLARFEQKYDKNPAAAAKLLTEGSSPADQHLSAPELAAYATVASVVLNLDEMVTKE